MVADIAAGLHNAVAYGDAIAGTSERAQPFTFGPMQLIRLFC